MCAVLILAAGCNQHASDSDSEAQAQAAKPKNTGAPSGEGDQIIWALNHELPDVSQFALLAIANFKLDGYQRQLREMSADSAVAALALAAVYQEADAPYEYFIEQDPGPRVGDVLGAAYGLGCAGDVPAAAWLKLVEAADEMELNEMLWGLAQLDVEPGGPLQRSAEFTDRLLDLERQAAEEQFIDRSGALDALLGDAERKIDWPVYVEYVPQSHWNSVQWAALLRWAPEDVWRQIIGDNQAHEAIQLELGKALALAGPAAIGLPGSGPRLITMGLGKEYRVVQFVQGQVDTMELPELDVLVGESDLMQGEEAEDQRFRQQAYQLALADVLQMLDYALIHNDEQLVQRLIDAMPELPEQARSGILAAIIRRRPSALSDSQLSQLIELHDGAVAYFLLQGWHDRLIVQQSDAVDLVVKSAGHENLIMASAYGKWLSQQ
jgi:hypothetical protein